MRRREFVTLGGAAAVFGGVARSLVASRIVAATLPFGLVLPPATAADQRPGKIPKIGYLSPGSASDAGRVRRFDAFRQGLSELGYVEGRNISLEPRWAEGDYGRYPALLAELIRLNVQAIVAVGGNATQAAQQATNTIPIVMSVVIDPIGSGIVSSLARPEGNVTGLTNISTDLVGKQFEFLKQAVPELARMALLWNPSNPSSESQLREAQAAADVLGVRVQAFEAQNPDMIGSAFRAMQNERADALVVLADGLLLNQRRQIADLAVKLRLPSASATREYAEAGGLLVYAADFFDLERRAATYVNKILKGVKPADLPVEQPIKFQLVLNLKTAAALGLTIPPAILARADEVIE
jgi:putative tryptophan/tyrosine transport system substrate-binding protein